MNSRYFDALNKGEQPPVKERLDYQLGQPLDSPVTKGALTVLHKQVKMLLNFLSFLIYISYENKKL